MKELPVVTSQKTEYRFAAGTLRVYRNKVLNIETDGAKVSEELVIKLRKAVLKLLGEIHEKNQTE